ncbi:hypothetical protein CAEBREN_03749 [Caenorhabditis brenneri]|uniref:Uncharacterized protein n=1 Tax=Caenorhabditis brenneri TaxID=135651 RepID=G0PA67_CAEBE|nr:hypothetical protein CAEBREN_03749 [Caenorhabditis brenneri]
MSGDNWRKPTSQQKTDWRQPDLKPAPTPSNNAWETGALAAKIGAPPTKDTPQAPPTPMMNKGPKSLTNAWKMATSSQKPRAPPKNCAPGPSGHRAGGPSKNYAPGPSRSRAQAPPPSKPAPQYEYLEGDLKKHKYASDLNVIFKNLMETGKVERTVAKPVTKPVKKKKEEDMIQRHPKWRWEAPFPKNPIRGDLVIIDDEWHAKNSLQRISNPKRKPVDVNKNP